MKMHDIINKYPFIPQQDQMDCGPACLAMIAKKYGKNYSLNYIRNLSGLTREGVSLSALAEAAGKIGFETFTGRLNLEQLIEQHCSPCVLYWNNGHYVVLYKIKHQLTRKKMVFVIADPTGGIVNVDEYNFKELWLNGHEKAIVMFLEPLKEFYDIISPPNENKFFKTIISYIVPFKDELIKLIVCLTIGTLFNLVFPFLTQFLVDKGLQEKEMPIIEYILIAQFSLVIGAILVEIVRNWVLLYVGTRINTAIISDFFKKLLSLPIKFFDTKTLGDINQRIYDHSRIEQFLTAQSLTTLFSLFNFSVFFFVLFKYNRLILLIYIVITIIAVYWSIMFQRRREHVDYFRFKIRSLGQESVNEMISGVQELKLNNFEDYKRREWERIQVKSFGINVKVLSIDQIQLLGYDFLNQSKNIAVTFVAAQQVVTGALTLGEMLSIMYIIGQLNSPVNQLVVFIRSLQDARLSMQRLTDINYEKEDEEIGQLKIEGLIQLNNYNEEKGIIFDNVSFQYPGQSSIYILNKITIKITEGKMTAIVGGSGSGKTTLMKLMLKIYEPTQGNIKLDGHLLGKISPFSLRSTCGIVMQDGYIFADTIERNIATGDETVNKTVLEQAIHIANIGEFIESLPLKEKTKIGATGIGLSGGQKQRILIARAVYKQPKYIFLDEATSSLDTENEKIIHDRLKEFFIGRTVVVIAHRLSTVKNADNLIVLNNGHVVEQGKHEDLIKSSEIYSKLVRNQIETPSYG